MDTIKGYLRDLPEVRFTPSGVLLTKFTLYDTPKAKGEYNRKFSVVVWEDLADRCNEQLEMGNFVYVKGYWKERNWENHEGRTIITKELTATGVWIQQADGQLVDIMSIPTRERNDLEPGESDSQAKEEMQTSAEMRSYLRSIRYYAEKIGDLSIQQIEQDNIAYGPAAGPGSVRFKCLGSIGDATMWLKTYCENIEANIQGAEKLDAKLAPIEAAEGSGR